MRRSALAAAGGLTIPLWAQWVGEQMDRMRPRKYFVLAEAPQASAMFPNGIMLPDGSKIQISDWTETNLYSTVVLKTHLDGLRRRPVA
jgi:hypothetical protein